MSGALVGMETKLGYVFTSSEQKRRVFKYVNVMNAAARNKNSEETDILERLFDL